MAQLAPSRLQDLVAQTMQQATLAGAPKRVPDNSGVTISGPGAPTFDVSGVPATAPRIGQKPKVSAWRVLDDVLGGRGTISESIDAQKMRALQQQQQAAMQAQIADLVQQTGMSPREALVRLTNPEEWAKQNAERYGTQSVVPNATVLFGDPQDGGEAYTAPPPALEPQLFHDSNGDVSQFVPTEDGKGYAGGRIYDAPDPAKAAGEWKMGPDGWYWVSADGSTPPKLGTKVGAAPKVFAPRAPRVGRGGGSPGVPAPAGGGTLDALGAELRRRGLLK